MLDARGPVSAVTRLRQRVMDAAQYATVASSMGDEEAAAILRKIADCKHNKTSEMNRLAELCDRYDNLYYPNTITEGGADHWPEDLNRSKPGMAHVSVNSYPIYVDIPASLQSFLPIENMVPANPEDNDQKLLAQHVERLYFAWKTKTAFEFKSHKCAVTKGLYGRCAAKVWWDDDENIPQFSIIDQPRNLWLGWADTDYNRLDWAIYAYKVSPNAAIEEYGVDVSPREYDGQTLPVIVPATAMYSHTSREWLNQTELAEIEVNDYWYRLPKAGAVITKGKRTPMETWNAILVGNYLVKNERRPEYDGKLPYVIVFNGYIPGVPDGRSEIYDVEQLQREKDERLSAGGTLVGKAVAGQYWQLVGPEAPDRVPTGVKPKPDTVIGPGAGNRVESIDPWMPEFQLENYLDRIDRELEDVSGLNDLMRGKAPPQVLSSSKAINALVANYEVRVSMKRDQFYDWRIGVWELAKTVWVNKETGLKPIFEVAAKLVAKNPSLTPRDDLEASTIAANLMTNRIWTQSRAMDHTGVEDTVAEQHQMREERTDASLFPQDVQVQMALLTQGQQYVANQQAMAAQSGGQPGGPPPAGAPPGAVPAEAPVMGTQGLNGPGETGATPPESLPANAGQAALAALLSHMIPGQGAMNNLPGGQATSQTRISNGQASNRLMFQSPLGSPPGGPPPGTPGG